MLFFFFKQKTAYEMRISDWSSDVCSSDLTGIPFPNIDPIALEIGPLVIRWYALAYIAGILLGWRYCLHLARRDTIRPNAQDFDDFVFWAVLGIILGGRIGYVAF